jgi:hypothetical protein
MGGGAVRANNISDGLPVTDPANRAWTNPSMEASTVESAGAHLMRRWATGGGVINMTAKAGTNEFHGSGYGVIRPREPGRAVADTELQNQPVDRSGGTTAALRRSDREE